MILKNNRKTKFGVTLVASLSWFSPAFAAPSLIATQSDLGKMWKTGGLIEVSSVPVSGQPFKTAISLTSPRKTANSWNVQGGANPKVALRRGDALVATFFVRSTKPTGLITFSVEGGPKYDRLAWQDIKISNKWKKVTVPFTSKGAYGPGKWQLTFKLGSMAQTVQIANFQLVTSA